MTGRYEVTLAGDLHRNSRVMREEDHMPYLVDRVYVDQSKAIQVTFSSGDVVVYPSKDHPVVTIA